MPRLSRYRNLSPEECVVRDEMCARVVGSGENEDRPLGAKLRTEICSAAVELPFSTAGRDLATFVGSLSRHGRRSGT
jgi:hypothetical protein